MARATMIPSWLIFTFACVVVPAGCAPFVTLGLTESYSETTENVHSTPSLLIEPDSSYPETTENSDINAVENLTSDLLEQINVSLSFEHTELRNLPYGFVRSEFLTHLSFEGSKIGSISNMACEFVPRLSHLNLANNLLRNIDLDQFSSLKSLKTLNLNGNCKMTETVVVDETIPDPDYESYGYNRYTTIRPPPREISIPCEVNLSAELTSLTKLYLENNNLKQLIFVEGTNFPRLTHLYLSGNQVDMDNEKMLKLSQLAPALSELHLERADITEFDLSHLPTVTSLFLNGNGISCICNEYCDRMALKLRDARNLKTLSVSQNHIAKIEADSFDHTTSLVSLDLSHNIISEIREGTFDNLHLLRSLSLDHNNLVRPTELHALRGLINLESLFLEHNNMRNITKGAFQSLVTLKTLKLDHNGISSIDSGTFSNLTKLKTLSLAGNQLSTIPDGCLPSSGSLIKLSLNNNKFTNTKNIPFANLPNLLSLSLKDNPLTTMTLNSHSIAAEDLTIILGNACQPDASTFFF